MGISKVKRNGMDCRIKSGNDDGMDLVCDCLSDECRGFLLKKLKGADMRSNPTSILNKI